MDFWAKKIGNGLYPDGDESLAAFGDLPPDKSLHVTVIDHKRSGPQHRLYWSVVRRVASGVGLEPENVSDLLKLATGHYDAVQTKHYGEVKLPKSISFAAMGGAEFTQFFQKCLDTIFAEWGIDEGVFSDLLVPTERR